MTPRTRGLREGWRAFAPALVVLVSAIVVFSPASAHHQPTHTAAQIRGLTQRVTALEKLHYITSPPVAVADGATGQVEALCPAGTLATGGGGFASTDVGFQVDSYPAQGTGFPAPNFIGAHGHRAWAFEWVDIGGDGQTATIRAYAVCLKVRGASSNYTPGSVPARNTSATRST
jgi:hypothetical protein